jgi:hypothetical protein
MKNLNCHEKNRINYLIMSILLVISFAFNSKAQLPDTWLQKADFAGISRNGAVGFSIGTKGYIGTGNIGTPSTHNLKKDFWEYDSSTDSWSQKADFGGTARVWAIGFGLNSKGYIGTGRAGSSTKDFWEYDPITNIWTKKSNFAGTARYGLVGFCIGDTAYMGTGYDGQSVNDFWAYNPSSDTWIQKSNFGGSGRFGAVAFNISNKGYIGTGNAGTPSVGVLKNDFWEYDPTYDTWTQKANVSDVGVYNSIGFSIGNFGYITSGLAVGTVLINSLFEYNPLLDSWSARADFIGMARNRGVGFCIGSKGYIGTGFDAAGNKNDFWEYTPSCPLPTITSQPDNQILTFGLSAIFSVTAIYASSYQWQEDSGSGFSNIIDGGTYSNSTTPELNISLPTVAMSGYKYRCVITGSCASEIISDGNATLLVSAKPILITANVGQSKLYGESDPISLAYTFTPELEGSDIITGELARVAGENAGNYAFVLGSLTAGSNYILSVSSSTTFTLNPANLTIQADNKYKCFDGNVFIGYTVSCNGFVYGEDLMVLDGTLAFGGNAITAINPGGYNIIPEGLSSVNYILTYVQGTLDIYPTPNPSITGPNSVCAGENSLIYSTEPGFTNYVWTISYGGIITSGLNSNSVSVDWATAGSRSISVNYQNVSGCNGTIPENFNVLVKSIPVPIISGENTVCEGAQDINYTTQIGYEDYLWEVSSGGTITSGVGTNAITINWTGSGNQAVSVDYTNELGCQSLIPTIYNVDVAALPASPNIVTGPSSICAGVSGVVFNVSPINNALTYEWTFPNGATIKSGAGTSSVTVDFAINSSSGIINVYGVNDCGVGPTSPDFNILVNTIPATPIVIRYSDTLISSSSSGNQWYLDGVAINGATGQEHIAVYTGTYHVVVTLNGCASIPSNSILVLPVSTNELLSADLLEIYPNPSNGSFNLNIHSNRNELFNIEIYNQLGVLVWNKYDILTNGILEIKVNIEGYPTGIYTIALRSKTDSVYKRIIITR